MLLSDFTQKFLTIKNNQMTVNIKEVKVNDVFSENVYYTVSKINSKDITLKHIQGGKEVTLSNEYVRDLLNTADQYEKEVEIGKEDKYWTQKQIDESIKKGQIKIGEVLVGDLKVEGVKSIWGSIGSKVFTVCFEKKGRELSKTAYDKLVKAQIENAVESIEKAASGKKGVANTAAQILEEVIRNPITSYEKGQERILRGYKISHESDNGFYDVVDLDIATGENKRQVNLNTIKWLVVGGVKYVVE